MSKNDEEILKEKNKKKTLGVIMENYIYTLKAKNKEILYNLKKMIKKQCKCRLIHHFVFRNYKSLNSLHDKCFIKKHFYFGNL